MRANNIDARRPEPNAQGINEVFIVVGDKYFLAVCDLLQNYWNPLEKIIGNRRVRTARFLCTLQ